MGAESKPDRRSHRTALASGLLGAAVALGCSKPPSGGLMLIVRSDMQVPDELDTILVHVAKGQVVEHKKEYSLRPGLTHYELPATLGIWPGKDPSSVITSVSTTRRPPCTFGKARLLPACIGFG